MMQVTVNGHNNRGQTVLLVLEPLTGCPAISNGQISDIAEVKQTKIKRVLPERIFEYLEEDKVQMVRNVGKLDIMCVTLY